MPCYYTGSEIGDLRLAMDESDKKTAKRITKLTSLLCAACTTAEAHNIILPAEVHRWWCKHKALDAKRKAKK